MSLIKRIFKVLFCAAPSRGNGRRKESKWVIVRGRNGEILYRVNEYGEVFTDQQART
jgi:hypothetical protein